jgi:hypothetical protein
VPNPKNWRRHPKAQVDALRGLLAEIGYADALLARELPDGRLMLIDGHLRAETTPDALVPVLVLDVNEEEADKILLTLDPLAAMAESDAERVKALLATVRTDSDAVQELLKRTGGDRLWEILHPHEVDEVEVSPEKAEEFKAKWGTERDQLWRIGSHRIICGDCGDASVVTRLWAGSGLRLRMIWTDPPYGVGYAAKTAWMARRAEKSQADRKRRPHSRGDRSPVHESIRGCDQPRGERCCYIRQRTGRTVAACVHRGDGARRLQLPALPSLGKADVRARAQ